MFDHIRTKARPVRWFRAVHDPTVVPKHALIGSLACQNKLPTLDNLIRRGLYLANQCGLCEKANEDVKHLFFTCAYSAQVWTQVGNWSAPLPLPRLLDWYMHYNKGKARGKNLRRVSLVTAIYMIWKERNARIFKDVKTSPQSLSIKLKYAIANRMYYCDKGRMDKKVAC
ncbi:uncharacterized protein LOC141617542 [Silene latifolia]|uniref:uncharacterized protein LOC141617542 n=1 Tax=Silene latifolia TaxID=37657 RepID=UPI003D7822B6